MDLGSLKSEKLNTGTGLMDMHCYTASLLIADGQVTYLSRFLQTDAYKKNTAANRIVVGGFGTVAYPDPSKTLFERVTSYFSELMPPGKVADNSVVNVYQIGGGFVASSGTDIVHQYDPDTLETKERLQFSKYVAVNMTTAHIHHDPDGTTYLLGAFFMGCAKYNIIKVPPPLVTQKEPPMLSGSQILCSIPARWKLTPAYCHSFGLTAHYIVFLEQPLCIGIPSVVYSKLMGKSELPINYFKFKAGERTQLHVVEKATGKAIKTKYMAETFFAFHHINTYEDEGHLVVDICCYENPYLFKYLYLDELNSEEPLKVTQEKGKPSVRRYVLPLQLESKPQGENLVMLEYTSARAVLRGDGTILCDYEKLSPVAFDFPQINYDRYNGKKYNYVFAALLDFSSIVKLDITTKRIQLWSEENCFVSEPVFVARPGALEEDDGVLLSAVLSSDPSQAPFLLVLDARTMEEVGRAVLPGVEMHKDLHGIFVPFK